MVQSVPQVVSIEPHDGVPIIYLTYLNDFHL